MRLSFGLINRIFAAQRVRVMSTVHKCMSLYSLTLLNRPRYHEFTEIVWQGGRGASDRATNATI